MASFKRWRKTLTENTSDSSMSTMLDSGEENGLQFYLNKLKNIKKKMASPQHVGSDVAIKSTSKNPQISISMDTALVNWDQLVVFIVKKTGFVKSRVLIPLLNEEFRIEMKVCCELKLQRDLNG